MSRVLFSVWFSIQDIIQNATCSVCSGFSVLLKNVQGIIQRLVQFSGFYSKYDLQRPFRIQRIIQKMSRVLSSVWFWIQRIIKNCPGYYSASGSVFSILFKNAQVIIQRLVQDPSYSRSQHRSRSWEAPRMPSLACPGEVTLKQRGSPGSPKSPRSNNTKKKKTTKFAFYSKINQVQNCSELTKHTKIDFKRSSAPGLNIAQVAWKPRACRHQACTGSIALKQQGSSRSPKSPPK